MLTINSFNFNLLKLQTTTFVTSSKWQFLPTPLPTAKLPTATSPYNQPLNYKAFARLISYRYRR